MVIRARATITNESIYNIGKVMEFKKRELESGILESIKKEVLGKIKFTESPVPSGIEVNAEVNVTIGDGEFMECKFVLDSDAIVKEKKIEKKVKENFSDLRIGDRVIMSDGLIGIVKKINLDAKLCEPFIEIENVTDYKNIYKTTHAYFNLDGTFQQALIHSQVNNYWHKWRQGIVRKI